jgi:predicted acyl esterase
MRLKLTCIAGVLLAACGNAPDGTDASLPDAVADAAADAVEDTTADEGLVETDAGGEGAEEVPGDPQQEVPADLPADESVEGTVDAPSEVPIDVSPDYRVRPTVEQVYIWDAKPGTAFEVVTPDGGVAATGTTDDLGSLVLRQIPPAPGYTVRPAADPDDATGPVEVTSVEGSLPPESFYAGQQIVAGYQYLTVRDGTTLSAFVTLPGPPDQGPYPTVVNYSGYSPSRPGQSMGSEVEPLCPAYPVLCDAPNDPSNLIAALNGFATVGVNMRGTGCSGGAYDYFETLQTLDGYDVVEIVANQPWAKHGKVGMVGLSFPGISQLFVAAARPPHLAAIAPQSVIADSLSSCLMPGGIYNDGFAFSWHENVLNGAQPYGHGWVKDVVDAGDEVCADNQKLHGQARDAIEENLDFPYYTDEVAKPVDPSAWVDKVEVPVFLTGQWQDEQTGPHFAALLDRFTGAPSRRFNVTNGVHDDGFSPQVLVEWLDFLHLYVARDVPVVPPVVKALGSMFMEKVYGAPIDFAGSEFEAFPDHASAQAAWEARPEVRVIFETGADPKVTPGAPSGTFEAEFASWPIPGTTAWRWYFQPGGALAQTAPGADGGASSFVHDPDAGQRTILKSGSIRIPQPDWDWKPLLAGKAVAFVSEPLAQDAVVVGHASADLWIRTDATDADLEVGLTEVRPDGKETYVQFGWLRASHRALRNDATELRPIHTFRYEDVEPLVPGEWTLARVEMMPHGHVFRAGSRIRVSVDTPGDSRAAWRFRLLQFPWPPTIDVGHDADHPSSVALPLVPGVTVPTALPECHALRGQPCRDYVALP